jgi:hypothetical protein
LLGGRPLGGSDTAIPPDLAELAVRDCDWSRLLDRVPIAHWARLAFKPNRLAFEASRQRRCVILAALTVTNVYRAIILTECPLNFVIWKAMLENASTVIEDQCILFADMRGNTEHPADHLAVKPEAFGRSC